MAQAARKLVAHILRFLVRHDRLRWVVARLFPLKSASRLVGFAGLDYTRAGASPSEIARQYAEAAHTFLGPNSATGNGDVDSGSSKHQLLIDITVVGSRDFKTGVQRSARSLVRQLAAEPPAGYRVELVYRSGGEYHYATRPVQQIDVTSGDVFLGLDLDLGMDQSARNWLRLQSGSGLKIYFVVYDILPLVRPDWFPSYSSSLFKAWLDGVTAIADGVACISKSVADQLTRWLQEHPVQRREALKIGYFHLGADIESSLPSTGVSTEDAGVIEGIAGRTTILMVGTVEPRKGYAQALDAFELLWAGGHDIKLVIVGKEGWSMARLVRRLRRHPELGKRLFWLESASDELLLKLYGACSAFLMASEGEGFGLPIVEAARHGLPVIARDLPVFREVAGDHAFYFTGTGGRDLADAINTWLHLYRESKHPRSEGIQWLTWEESSAQLRRVIFESNWSTSWEPPSKLQP